jgi:hypothetical protein
MNTSVPVGRMGTTDDIAYAVSFFTAESAGFITGQRIVVDGVEVSAPDRRASVGWLTSGAGAHFATAPGARGDQP